MLQSSVLLSDTLFGRLTDIALSGGFAWVGDFSGDRFVDQIDIATGEIVAALGRRGAGPGEFRSIVAVLPVRDGSGGVWAFDLNAERLTRFVPGAAPRIRKSPEIVNFGWTSTSPLTVVDLGPRFVTWTTAKDSQLVFRSRDGTIARVAAGTFLGSDSVPMKLRARQSAAVTLCAKPDGSEFAIAYAEAGKVEIRDSAAHLVALAAVPYPSNGSFSKGSDGRSFAHETWEYYTSCTATDSLLIALFSGRDDRLLPTGGYPVDANYSREVHVFDWRGNLVGIWGLDHDVTAIAIDSSGSSLYGTDAGTSTIYRFALPTTLSTGIR